MILLLSVEACSNISRLAAAEGGALMSFEETECARFLGVGGGAGKAGACCIVSEMNHLGSSSAVASSLQVFLQFNVELAVVGFCFANSC